ncbi:MAG: hypothetical protein AAGH19_04090 [Pseudomonadota bacterium]
MSFIHTARERKTEDRTRGRGAVKRSAKARANGTTEPTAQIPDRSLACFEQRYAAAVHEAEAAYLCGHQQLTEAAFRRAFDLSVILFQRAPDQRRSVQRLLEASHHCFDFCRLPQDEDQHYPLEVAGRCLEAVVSDSGGSAQRRTEALFAYAEIAKFAEELVQHTGSRRAALVLKSFKGALQQHWPVLAGIIGARWHSGRRDCPC